MKTKLAKIISVVFLCLLVSIQLTNAQVFPVNAYFFYGEGCPHCGLERTFLFDVLKDEYPNLEIYEFEIYKDRDNALLLQQIATKLEMRVEGVPFLIIGDESFSGWSNTITPPLLREKVQQCSLSPCSDIVNQIIFPEEAIEVAPEPDTSEKGQKIINLPIFGEIDAMAFSLPALTIILGLLDGFNPCAMWVLIFLIGLLLTMKDKKRMWLLGSSFIITSAFVYFLFMAAWLNLITFLGIIAPVRIAIGLVAIGGGIYSFKEFLYNKAGTCKITDTKKRKKTFDKMKKAVEQNSLWLALGGIIVLAFAVNLVELVCSAGLPAVYIQVLVLNNLVKWQYYLYILLYIFFFMIDDLFVFFAAMKTLQITGMTTKYTRFSRLIGGIIMLAIGLLLIFRPEWLMVG